LRARVSDLDVRTDQCDFIRIHLRRSMIAIVDEANAIVATWIEFSMEHDFESKMIGEYASEVESEVVEAVKRWVVQERCV
jgi:hypothetical protein